MSLRLTVVGCGDAFGSGGQSNTCFHLDDGSRRWFLDFGASAMVASNAAGIDINAVDAIFLSHLHGDHFGGIPFLILHAQFVTDRTAPLTIAGPPGVEARIRAAQEIMFPESTSIDLSYDIRFVEMIPGETADICGMSVSTVEVSHPSGAPPLALRLERGGRALAFSGDSEWLDVLVDISREADLFICECYAFEQAIPYHVRYRDIETHLSQLTAKRIMLTHLGPEMLENVEAIDPAIGTLRDGMVIEI